jgi:hypothetical protein
MDDETRAGQGGDGRSDLSSVPIDLRDSADDAGLSVSLDSKVDTPPPGGGDVDAAWLPGGEPSGDQPPFENEPRDEAAEHAGQRSGEHVGGGLMGREGSGPFAPHERTSKPGDRPPYFERGQPGPIVTGQSVFASPTSQAAGEQAGQGPQGAGGAEVETSAAPDEAAFDEWARGSAVEEPAPE